MPSSQLSSIQTSITTLLLPTFMKTYLVPILHINEIIKYCLFSACSVSLETMSICGCESRSTSFFKTAGTLLPCECASFHLFLHQTGCLLCFHFLAVTNSTSRETGRQMSLCHTDVTSSDTDQVLRLLGFTVVQCFTFSRATIQSSILSVLIYIPTNSVRGFSSYPSRYSLYFICIYFRVGVWAHTPMGTIRHVCGRHRNNC